MRVPETPAEKQVAQILEETKFGDGNTEEYVERAHVIVNHAREELLRPQSYGQKLDDETTLWRARLILPSGGVTAAATAAIAFRFMSPELAAIATSASFLVGLGLGDALAIGVAHLRLRRSS